jgi:UDP-glucose 4-epimerase
LLQKEKHCQRFNLGNGNGYSVSQIIDVAKQITGKQIKIKQAVRRDGDPARLVADAALAKKVLNWIPVYSTLEEIIEHAWKWEVKQSC